MQRTKGARNRAVSRRFSHADVKTAACRDQTGHKNSAHGNLSLDIADHG